MKLICLFLLVVPAFCRNCSVNPLSLDVQKVAFKYNYILRFTCRHRQKAREYALYDYRGDPDALIEEFVLDTPLNIIARRLWYKFKELDVDVDRVFFACFTGETSISCASSDVPLGKNFPHFKDDDEDEGEGWDDDVEPY